MGYMLMIVSTVLSVFLMMMTSPELAIIFITMIFVLHAFSNAIFSPQNKRIMMSSVAPEDRNAASSFSSVISTLGSVFGTMILVNLIRESSTMESFIESSFILFSIILVVSILGLLVIYWRRKMEASKEAQ